MRWTLGVLGGVAGVGVFAIAPSTLAGVTLLGLVGALVFWTSRCHHPGPLGLLPPVPNADGTRRPAHWFCSACGKSWPAHLEQEAHVIRRFDGFDPSKAVDAARRATELERRQRQIAVKQSGVTVQPRVSPPAADVAPLSLVHFKSTRRPGA